MSYFDITRKIIASITTDSWRNVPHLVYLYEADADKLMEAVRSYNSSHPKEEKLSVNSAVLKMIIEGIKAGPALNGHVFYDHALVRGRIELSDHIDISTPVLYKDGKMMNDLLNLPYNPKYRWAFVPDNSHVTDYSKGYIMKDYQECLRR